MQIEALPIYLLPGMTAEYPVFSRLTPRLPIATVVEYIKPKREESLPEYAARMADRFTADSCIVGVSFGGTLALEISRIVRPNRCVLISSICHPRELPPLFRLGRLASTRNCDRILQVIGSMATGVPSSMCTPSTMRLRKLAGTGGEWHRWATGAVLGWRPARWPAEIPLLKIHGNLDRTFPLQYVDPDVVIRGGRHSLPISHPDETADAILDFLN